MTDPQFERYTIELLKGIYENVGAAPVKPYDIISGFFRIDYDSDWILEVIEVINETSYGVVPGNIAEGFVQLVVPNVYTEGSPYRTKFRRVQIINSDPMHPANVISCEPTIDNDKNLFVDYISLNAVSAFNPDSRGLGYEKEFLFSFEIRLYKE